MGKSGHSRVQEMNEDHPTRTNPGIAYNCGGSSFSPSFRFNTASIDCGSEVVLRPGDIVICRECGYRILFKKRTKQGKWTSVYTR